MDMFCPLVAPLAEKINFSPKQKFSEFQRICHIYVSNWALCPSQSDPIYYIKWALFKLNRYTLYYRHAF